MLKQSFVLKLVNFVLFSAPIHCNVIHICIRLHLFLSLELILPYWTHPLWLFVEFINRTLKNYLQFYMVMSPTHRKNNRNNQLVYLIQNRWLVDRSLTRFGFLKLYHKNVPNGLAVTCRIMTSKIVTKPKLCVRGCQTVTVFFFEKFFFNKSVTKIDPVIRV